MGRLYRFLVLALILISVAIQFLGVVAHPFSYIEVRGRVLDQFMSSDMTVLDYRRFYTESALAQFSPLFPHHPETGGSSSICFFPTTFGVMRRGRSLENLHLEPPLWVIGDRAIPFWWPVALPMFSEKTEAWVYPLAITSFLALLWGGLRVGRLPERDRGIACESLQPGILA